MAVLVILGNIRQGRIRDLIDIQSICVAQGFQTRVVPEQLVFRLVVTPFFCSGQQSGNRARGAATSTPSSPWSDHSQRRIREED